MQERFRTVISHFELVSNTSARMLKAAKILDVPVFTTEQNPKGISQYTLMGEQSVRTDVCFLPFCRFSVGCNDCLLDRSCQGPARDFFKGSASKEQVQHGPAGHYRQVAQERR